MGKHWEDKSQWIIHCPVCFCAVTHHMYDWHIQYHENKTPISEIGDGREIPVNYVDTFNDIIDI